MKTKELYINRDELYAEIINYRETNEISNRLGELLILMCQHILRHSNFKNYSEDLKEEMQSHALYLMIKYLHNVDPYKRNSAGCFNYITSSIFNGFKQVLKKYYKQQNLKRELIEAARSQFDEENNVNVKKCNYYKYTNGE